MLPKLMSQMIIMACKCLHTGITTLASPLGFTATGLVLQEQQTLYMPSQAPPQICLHADKVMMHEQTYSSWWQVIARYSEMQAGSGHKINDGETIARNLPKG